MAGGIEYIHHGDTTPETFAGVLSEKVRRAGNMGLVCIEGDVFDTFYPINLPDVRVTIRGLGAWKPTIRRLQKSPNKDSAPGLINVGCDRTVLQRLKVVCMEEMKYHISSCGINTNGYSHITVQDSEIINFGIGIGTPSNRKGLIPHGLTINRTTFIDCIQGVHWNRLMSACPAHSVNTIRITDCKYHGDQLVGVSIDCGNDGLDGNPQLGDLRSQLGMDTVTDMCDMEISGCTFDVATKYNVALAKVGNVKVVNNHFKGALEQFGESINIEHSSYNILVEGNKFTGGVSKWKQAHISIITFRDYLDSRREYFGRDPSTFFPEDGCEHITIRQNDFRGSVTNFVYGEYSSKISVVGNYSNHSASICDKFSFWYCNELNLQECRNLYSEKLKKKINHSNPLKTRAVYNTSRKNEETSKGWKGKIAAMLPCLK